MRICRAKYQLEEMSAKILPLYHCVKQGCSLASTLFTLYLAAFSETVAYNLGKVVYIRTRSDGKLYNLSRLKASTKTRELCVRELPYADESALVDSDADDIQEIANGFSSAASLFWFKDYCFQDRTAQTPPPAACAIPLDFNYLSYWLMGSTEKF